MYLAGNFNRTVQLILKLYYACGYMAGFNNSVNSHTTVYMQDLVRKTSYTRPRMQQRLCIGRLCIGPRMQQRLCIGPRMQQRLCIGWTDDAERVGQTAIDRWADDASSATANIK
jgi:hypothetical protein